jgi:hypothetical protein
MKNSCQPVEKLDPFLDKTQDPASCTLPSASASATLNPRRNPLSIIHKWRPAKLKSPNQKFEGLDWEHEPKAGYNHHIDHKMFDQVTFHFEQRF